MRLNVLDQSPIPEGSTAGDALRNTIDLARTAERLGYYRYWLAEHHGTPGLACASPEVMVGQIAAATSRLHVGTGGVMLPHYSPLKVAETFSMLTGLFPGRIDLGLGRAPGTSAGIAYALQRDRRQAAPDDFPEQLTELLGYLENRGPSTGPFRQTAAMHFETPEPWLLGSSAQSGIWAAEMGLPYCFADFINPNGEAIVEYYREHFEPSARLQSPRVAVATWAICAETDEEAQRLASSMRMLMLMLYRGQLIPVPSVEKAEAFLAREGVAADSVPVGRRIIVGTPEKVRAMLEDVVADYGAEELFVINIMHDHEKRKRSYELIARAFGLSR
ncbi:MAG TPA: LLM class flavin-dependent oxidoreductase [Bryobacteraceae bacterium]|nr:LLM class flavin-dependent oxidoreductase [Bryobacteraceae bacterium]